MTGHEATVDTDREIDEATPRGEDRVAPAATRAPRLRRAGLQHPVIPAHELLINSWAPVDVVDDTAVIATSAPDVDRVRQSARTWLPGRRLSIRDADHAALQNAILRNREDEVADYMANHFPRTHPELTGKGSFAWWQIALAVLCPCLAVLLLVLTPGVLAAMLASVFVTVSVINFGIALASLTLSGRDTPAPANTPAGGGPNPARPGLPFYTVLVPAYQEEAVIGELVRCLGAIDYPPDRLEVLFLVEKHDPATKAAILEVGLEPFMRVVELPTGPPQTKPRSCNLGLLLARGDLLVIFDAEDRPDRDQLLKAAKAFTEASDEKLACVQAKLFFDNATQNLLTHQFAMEYDLRYELILPGVARLGLPISLGGTSNHFRTDILRRIGGWDAWNVTEDADLGMRCKALGYRVDVIDSVTREDATSAPGPWIRQRTRWLKGFMMTTLVHTRRPLRSLRRFGPSGMVTLLGIMGGTVLTYLCQPVAALLILLDLCGALRGGGAGVTSTLTSGLLVATALWVTATVLAMRRRGTPFAYLAVLLPGYWLLHWIAAWRALLQLIRAPFQWEKTPHRQHAAAPERDTRSELAR